MVVSLDRVISASTHVVHPFINELLNGTTEARLNHYWWRGDRGKWEEINIFKDNTLQSLAQELKYNVERAWKRAGMEPLGT